MSLPPSTQQRLSSTILALLKDQSQKTTPSTIPNGLCAISLKKQSTEKVLTLTLEISALDGNTFSARTRSTRTPCMLSTRTTSRTLWSKIKLTPCKATKDSLSSTFQIERSTTPRSKATYLSFGSILIPAVMSFCHFQTSTRLIIQKFIGTLSVGLCSKHCPIFLSSTRTLVTSSTRCNRALSKFQTISSL